MLVDLGQGEEPGQIVVAPDQWLEPAPMDGVPVIVRTLEDEEIEGVARNIKRARAMIPAAADTVRETAPGCFLTGLRLISSGDRAVVVLHGEIPDEPESLRLALADVLGLPCQLEQDQFGGPEHALIGGGTGVPAGARSNRARGVAEQRIDVLRESSAFAPHGMPRLNSRVSTPTGTGVLIAVDIRHWRATVQFDGGEEASLSVDDLREP